MKLWLAIVAPLVTTSCVDAVDQGAQECEQKMLPLVLAEAAKMPSDASLQAGSAEVEHVLEGGEARVRAAETNARSQWKKTRVEPLDEITFGLILMESAVGFRSRAASRVEQLCSFAEANRIKYETWRVGMRGFATHASQSSKAASGADAD